ncbi:MAG TPA: SDR family NAD(P)-dependent oxidoreductase, partial [Thermoleophilaceae bacterium]
YWVRHVREAVRFADGIRTLASAGVTRFLELGPDGVLSAMAALTVEGDGALAIPLLRHDRREPEALTTALAAAHAAGAKVDWSAVNGSGRTVELPTYAFQRERYWLEARGDAGDVTAAGLGDVSHPLLGARVAVASEDEWILTGRLSLASQPWLRDHAIGDTAVLPSSAFVELALTAALEAGAAAIDELTLEAPLALAEDGAVELQVVIGSPDADGRRDVSIHSRAAASDGEEAPWTRHAAGALSPARPAQPPPAPEWPPDGAEPVEVEFLYDRLAEIGFGHGPAFQRASAAWRRGDELFAEVSLAEEHADDAGRFALHPVLLDAAFHPALIDAAGAEPRQALDWTGVGLHATGAGSLRVHLVPAGEDAFRLNAYDATGAPVLTAGAVRTRGLDMSGLAPRRGYDELFRAGWVEVPLQSPNGSRPHIATLGDGIPLDDADRHPDLASLQGALDAGEAPPDVVLVHARQPDPAADLPVAVHDAVHDALDLLRGWLADARLIDSRLVVVTSRAVAASAGEAPDLASAPLWGVVGTADAESPGRFVLADVDGAQASWDTLPAALAVDEPRFALRDGVLLAPRMERVVSGADGDRPRLDGAADGTILVTGGTRGLGATMARHLAREHGARHLLLVSRRGAATDGVAELTADLAEAGCEAHIEACDVADRDQLAALLDSIPAERPLRAVVHAAGVIDDGTIETLDREQVERVLRPKVDAAFHLHELTEAMDLSAFILFSCVVVLLGGAGQANYTAANAFLDALAHHRRAGGLPATSLAWGMWNREVSGMLQALAEAGLDRALRQVRERLGMVPLETERGLELFDVACTLEDAMLVPVKLDRATLRVQAREGRLPAATRGLVRVPARRAAGGASALARRLADTPAADRDRVVLDLVRAQVASVLGFGTPEEVDPERAFREVGVDSLMAIALRNALERASGLRLPATLVFDHPTAAAVAVHLRREAEGAERGRGLPPRAAGRTDEPIAIVGMACRYPGGVRSPEDLWELVASGTDAIGGFPADRGWELDRLYHPDPDNPGTTYTRHGGFVEDAAGFDAAFFGISPREALAMDPQQRLLLETAWEAFESAGIDPASVGGSPTGVFAGMSAYDYGFAGIGSPELEGYVGSGGAPAVLSGRVAYYFGLEGPAVTVDTACSSSLVALHLASQALRNGECSLALAGGACIMPTPFPFVEFGRQRVLAEDGRCKSFAASADGTGWGEGVGLLLVERLSDAERRGHDVLAVVRATATNQDGASNGLGAPNGPSQERAILQALASAGLSPADVDAVEAHGTGTALGDPIEAHALLATYGRERADGEPLWLGSIKSNIGHTQAAAGAAGVMKMVMALRNGRLPKTLHAEEPSPHIDWSAGAVELLREARPWEPRDRPRRAGVSSFGMSGTNAHVILEEAPASTRPDDAEAPAGEPALDGVLPWVVSAKGDAALRTQAARLHEHLSAHPELNTRDVAHSLLSGRAQLEHRAAAVGTDRDELLAGLGALARGEPAPGVVRGNAGAAGRVVFVFPGHGSQWPGMASDLLDSSPIFAEHLEACSAAVEQFVDWSLHDVLRGVEGAPSLEHVNVAQPALFVVMASLAATWRAYGVEPSAVIGHSQGEVTAAYVAGALTLEDAARIVTLRSKTLLQLLGRGAMALVGIPLDDLRPRMERFGERVTISALNSPTSIGLAGEREALEELVAEIKDGGQRARMLQAPGATHCPEIEAVRDELLDVLAPVSPRSAAIPFYSTVEAAPIDTSALDAHYWYRNVREPVSLEPTVRLLVEHGHRSFVETSPHPALTVLIEETLDAATAERTAVLSTLRRGEGAPRRLVESLCEAHVAGVAVDLAALTAGARRVPLPTYAFQNERFWLTPGAAKADPATVGQRPADHPLIGAALVLAGDDGHLFTGRLALDSQAWLRDHALMDTVILPGTAFVELALRAGAEVGLEAIEELTLEAPLVIAEEGALQLQLKLGAPDDAGRRELSIHARPEPDPELEEPAPFVRHARATLAPGSELLELARLAAEAWPPAGADELDTGFLYDRLIEHGFGYGPAFQGLRKAWRRGDELFAEVALDEAETVDAGRFGLHPALLDAALHAIALAVEGDPAPRLPWSFGGVQLAGAGASSLRVRLVSLGEGEWQITAVDQHGSWVAAVDRFVTRPVDATQINRMRHGEDALHRVDWIPAEAPATNGSTPRVAAVGEDVELIGAERHADLAALIAALDGGEPAPDIVIAGAGGAASPDGASSTELADAARGGAARALALLKAWLAEERLGSARLVVVTRGAVAARPGEAPELATAPVWGLLRSAQSEHPGRFV